MAKKEFSGVFIHKDIFTIKKLTWLDKVIFGSVIHLNKFKTCTISNDQIGVKIGATKSQVSKAISKFKELGLVTIKYDGKSKAHTLRFISVVDIEKYLSEDDIKKRCQININQCQNDIEQCQNEIDVNVKMTTNNISPIIKDNRERETPAPAPEKQLPKHMIATDCLLVYLKENEDMRNTLRQLSGFKGTDKQMAQEAKDFCSYYYDSGILMNQIIKNPMQATGKFQVWLRRSRDFNKNNKPNHKLLN